MASARDAASDGASGTVSLQKAGSEAVNFSPATCRSGEHRLFLGADFLDTAGQTARVVIDPLGGSTLRFFSEDRPQIEGTIFRKSDCTTFNMVLDRTGWWIDDIYDLKVQLDFTCRLNSGEAASGTLSAAHCH